MLAKRKAATCCKPPYLLEYIRKPMITLSSLTVRKVGLIIISLLLKGNGTVSFMTVSEDDKPYKPFDEIPQVEKYIKHFLHLLGMYLFVIEGHVTDWLVSSCEENPE